MLKETIIKIMDGPIMTKEVKIEQLFIGTKLTIEHYTLSNIPMCYITIKHDWEKAKPFVVKFEDIKGKSGKDIIKILKKPNGITCFFVPTKKYWDYYFKSSGFDPDLKDEDCYVTNINAIRKLLSAGKLDNFVDDTSWYDGWFRDIEGNPISRKYHFDCISGFTGTAEEIINIETKLKKDKRVSGIKIVEIPYYNRDFTGQMGIEFWYSPTKKEIKDLIKDSFYGRSEIKKRWASD